MCLLLGDLSVTGGYSRSDGSVSCDGGGLGGSSLWGRDAWEAVRLIRRRSASS